MPQQPVFATGEEKEPLDQNLGRTEKFIPEAKAQLYLAGLDRSMGSQAQYDYDFYGGSLVGTDRLHLSDESPVELFVEATSIEDGVNIQISGIARVVGCCERCLEDFDDTLEVDLNRIYYYEAAYRKLEKEIALPQATDELENDSDFWGTPTNQNYGEFNADSEEYTDNWAGYSSADTWVQDLSETLDEAYILDDKNWQIDLFPMLVDAIVPQIPIKVICTESCPGLCSECGRAMVDLEPGHTHAGQAARQGGMWAWADELSQYRDRLAAQAGQEE